MMKIFNKILFVLIISLFAISCSEDYEPFGVYRENYIMNSVLRSDTTQQIVTVSSSYNIRNFETGKVKDPAIEGAIVRIWEGDKVEFFSEASVPSQPGGRYSTPFIFYTVDNFVPKAGTTYEIEALLPNGRRLKSTTTLPKKISFYTNISKRIPPEDDSEIIHVAWFAPEPDRYVAARFKVVYFKNENGTEVRYEKIVPQEYIEFNGKILPHYPEPSFANSIEIELKTFSRAMEEISEGEPDKTKFKILAFILEIMVYDEYLTSYYASTSAISEDFSISLDQAEYTNIEGGLGIFGSFYKQRTAVKFTHEYIRSFGYEPGLTE